MIIHDTKIKVSYDGKEHSSGLVSFVSFDNPDFKKALREMFACKNNEQIVGIDVDKGGITAYIKTDKA